LSCKRAKLLEAHQRRYRGVFIVRYRLISLGPPLHDSMVFGLSEIQCEAEQFNPWNDCSKRSRERHLDRPWVLMMFREPLVVDLIGAKMLSISLLKEHAMIPADVVLVVGERQPTDVQRNCGPQLSLLESVTESCWEGCNHLAPRFVDPRHPSPHQE